MLDKAATALVSPSLNEEAPHISELQDGDDLFYFNLTVLPHEGKNRCLRFRIFQDYLDDGAPYRVDIRFDLTPAEAEEIARALKAWCAKPDYAFVWKAD